MSRYSKTSRKSIKSAMEEMKKGKLKTGTGATVKNPKQAIAIGLSEARQKGAKVPPKKAAKNAVKQKAAKKSDLGKTETTTKKSASKRAPAKNSGTIRSAGSQTNKKSAAKKSVRTWKK